MEASAQKPFELILKKRKKKRTRIDTKTTSFVQKSYEGVNSTGKFFVLIPAGEVTLSCILTLSNLYCAKLFNEVPS